MMEKKIIPVGDVEIVQQDAQQHHPAGHTEDAGKERGKDDSGSDQSQGGEGHFGMSLRRGRQCPSLPCPAQAKASGNRDSAVTALAIAQRRGGDHVGVRER
jgi:hypothetical protein